MMTTSLSPTAQHSPYLEAGTAGYRRAVWAIFLGGFATFALLYGPQPLLPLLGMHFGISPAHASLSVSASTAAMAVMVIPASLLSDRYGRSLVMKASLTGSALFALLVPLVQDFHQFLLLRILLGVAIAGLPATAIAWLGEEIAPNARGRAIGLYIAGTAFGGMAGRFSTALITAWSDWQTAFLALGIVGAMSAILFWRSVPDSRHFKSNVMGLPIFLKNISGLFRDFALTRLFAVSFLLMGTFVALYNYLGFRLQLPPFGLSQVATGTIFLLYALGSVASAWAGSLADRLGRKNVLWMMVLLMAGGLWLTIFDHLSIIIIGVALFTFGFFGSHSVASGWVGERARQQRALAAAVYLTFYYLGASVIGSLAGLAWDQKGWVGVSIALGGCLLIILVLARQLQHTKPSML
jgi:YNFM family putative membrane transporter